MKTALVLMTALSMPIAATAQTEPAKAKKESPKPAPKKAPATPVIGSMDAAPERKLGAAKEPCVYKPVMTAQDMENCK